MASDESRAATQSEEPHLRIGEVAERLGVTERTLRFYEEKGLLKPPTRMEGGFRLYSDDDVRRVERIRSLQKLLGFTLAEIKEMVETEEVKMQLRAGYRSGADLEEERESLTRAIEVTERQCSLIRQKTDALMKMQGHLEERLAEYRGWLRKVDAALDEKASAKDASTTPSTSR